MDNKNELGGKIMTESVASGPKTYSYLIDDGDEKEKAKSTKKCVKKQKLKTEDHKHRLEASQIENEINQLEKHQLDVNGLREKHKKFIKTID